MAKAKSTKARAAKAIEKARGKVYFAELEAGPMGRTRKKVERAEKAGANVNYKRQTTSRGNQLVKSVAKTDVAASNKKTLKASGTGFKSTARQVKLERERTATRAAAMAKRAKKK